MLWNRAAICHLHRLKDKSKKDEARFLVFFSKRFPTTHIGKGHRESKWNMMKCWHNTAKDLTQWWTPPHLQNNSTWPSGFASHPALWRSYGAQRVHWGNAVSAQHLREFLIPWSIDLQESSTVILISHHCFNSATCLLSAALRKIISMFNCNHTKDLCETVKVNGERSWKD